MSVSSERRFTRNHPCPICGGHDRMPRGQGTRCHGFLSSDGRFAHCTREARAAGLQFNPESGTYGHRLDAPCDCGETHAPVHVQNPKAGRVLCEQDFDRCPHPYPCDYCDENGVAMYRVARWPDHEGAKDYACFRPDGPGRWLAGLDGARRVIYRLPETRAAILRCETVFIAEGEKCVHVLVALGVCATTNDGGAGKWRAEHTAGLRGAPRVLVVPDNDEPGRRHTETVAAELHGAGVPDVRIVALPGLPEGEDVADWVAKRRSAETSALRAELEKLADAAQQYQPTPRPARERPSSQREPQGRTLDLEDADPWPEPVDGAAVLDEVAAVVRRFIVLPDSGAHAAALWAAMTWCVEHVAFAVRLIVTSPTRACGKSNLLAVLATIVRRPLLASSITPAALFRTIEAAAPTLLLDEMDNARLDENDELRALLNSGHSRGSAYVIRTVGEQHEPRRFSTWCAMAFASIGHLPDTVASRGITVGLQRKARGAAVERLREARLREDLDPLRCKLARWAADHGAQLADADPTLPVALDGRVADNWGVLVALAEAAGGAWPERGSAEALGEVLLADLRDLFDERAADRLASAEIGQALALREDRPWPESNHGKPITPRQIASRLRPFGIEPRTVRLKDGSTAKGYHREQFEAAWESYTSRHPLPDPSPRHTVLPARQEPPCDSSHPGEGVTDEKRAAAANGGACDGVTDPRKRGGADVLDAALARRWEPVRGVSAPWVPHPCRNCNGTRFWRHRLGGEPKCARCHPAPAEDLVGEWIEPRRAATAHEALTEPREPHGHGSERAQVLVESADLRPDPAPGPEPVGTDATRRPGSARTLLPPAPVPKMPCDRCGGTRFWLSRYGSWWCFRCRPSDVPELVVDRLDLSGSHEGRGPRP